MEPNQTKEIELIKLRVLEQYTKLLSEAITIKKYHLNEGITQDELEAVDIIIDQSIQRLTAEFNKYKK